MKGNWKSTRIEQGDIEIAREGDRIERGAPENRASNRKVAHQMENIRTNHPKLRASQPQIKAAIFASGAGSNFLNIMEKDDLQCEVVLLVCDKQGANAIEKAARYGVPTFVFNPKKYASKADYEHELVWRLRELNVTWIFLAGYMRIVGPDLLLAYENHIVNVHPSLLPNFPGKDAIGQAFNEGVKQTGVTVHYIDEGIDTGPIIAQETVDVFPHDTEETLKNRIHKVEHNLYPNTINQLMKEQVQNL